MSLFRLPRVASTAVVAGVRAQDRREHLLDRGLAVRAGDRDERRRERARQCAPGRRARAACRRPRSAAAAYRRDTRAVDHRRGRRAAARAASRKSWPSKRSPRSATNSSPAWSAAAVGRHAGEPRVARRSRGRRARRRLRRGASSRSRRASAARASSASENGSAAPRDLLVGLVPLAGDQHDVAARAPARSPARSPRGGRPLDLARRAHAWRDLGDDRRRDPRCAGCRW